MLLPGDWGQGKSCTLYMFKNIAGDADDPEYRNPRLPGNVSYETDFRAQKDFLGPLFKSLVTIQVSTSGTWAPIGLQNGGN